MTITFNWSTTVLCISIVTGLAVLLTCAFLVYKYITANPFKVFTYNTLGILTCVIVALLMLEGTPLSLTCNKKGIHIQEIFSSTNIPANEILGAKPITLESLGNITRINGSGGFGGYYGKFHSSILGNYISFITDKSQPLILVETSKTKYVIGCAEAQQLETLINEISSGEK